MIDQVHSLYFLNKDLKSTPFGRQLKWFKTSSISKALNCSNNDNFLALQHLFILSICIFKLQIFVLDNPQTSIFFILAEVDTAGILHIAAMDAQLDRLHQGQLNNLKHTWSSCSRLIA